jgi:hypothetical protein
MKHYADGWKYSPEIEQHMKMLYDMLSEKDRRMYAAIETQKLPRGGLTYIADLFGCDPKTIRRGLQELQTPETLPQTRVRRTGGGRQRKLETIPEIDEEFLDIMRRYTEHDAGNGKTHWTTLPYAEIARRLQKRHIDVSERIVKQLFRKYHYRKR